MSMGYDATASLQPLNYTTSFTNPAQWTMGNNAYLNQYSQGVQGQILQDTQRSLTANADRMMQWTLSPSAGYYGEGGGGNSLWSGGTGGVFDERNAGSGATMAQLQQPWLTPSGGVNNIISGGGMYQGPSPFSSGGYGGPSIDWGNVGRAAADLYQPSYSPLDASGFGNQIDWGGLFGSGGARVDPYPGMSMPGGLNSPMTMPQQQPLDYGSLFGQGAGGMGGAPQQPAYTSGIEPDQTGGRTYSGALDAPMEGAPPSTMDWSTLFGGDTGGMAMPGGLNSPMTVPEQYPAAYDYGSLYGKGTEGAAPSAPDGTRTYDLAPMFEGGGGGGFGTGGSDTSGLFGATAPSLGGDAFSYNKDPMWQDASPDTLAEQARARLAGLMSGEDRTLELKTDANDMVIPERPGAPTELPAEVPAAVPAEAPAEGPFDNVPQPVTPEARTPATDVYPGENPPRPPADIKQGTGLRDSPTLRGVNPRLLTAVQGGSTFLPPGYTVGAVSGVRPGQEQAHHRTGKAMDVQIFTPDGKAIPHKGEDTTGMYTKLAQGVKAWVQQNDPELMQTMRYGGAFGTQRGGGGVPDLMHYDLGLWPSKANYGAMRPEVGFGVLQPMSAEEQRASLGSQIASGITAEAQRYAEGPGAPLAERAAGATVEERPGVNQGQTISSPPADIPPAGLVGPGFNALDAAANVPTAAAAPVKHSGLELARANIDTPIEKLAMERGGQKAVDQVSFMAMGKTPRQLAEQYGSMFMDRAEPLFKSLGITRQDFEKAAQMPPTKQDIKMRFGDFGTEAGGELPAMGWNSPFSGLSGSRDFENRSNEQLGRDQLAQLQTSYEPLPEVASTPLGMDLGLGGLGGAEAASNVVGPTISAFTFDPSGYGEGGYGNAFTPTQTPEQPSTAPYGPEYNPMDRYAGQGGGQTYEPGAYTQTALQSNNPEYQGYNALDQSLDLRLQREPLLQELQANPTLLRQFLATMNAEGGIGADRAIAQIMEATLNRGIATDRSAAQLLGIQPNGFPTTDPQRQYFEPWQAGGTGPNTLALINRDEELRDRLANILNNVVLGGTNTANLATENASGGVGRRAGNTQTIAALTGPPVNETLARKDIDARDARGRLIHGGMPMMIRDWYANLMPGDVWTQQPPGTAGP